MAWEIDISKAQQEKIKAKSIWNNRKFASLMAYDPKAAAQFAIDCWVKTAIHWIPVEDYVKWVEKLEEVEAPVVEEKESETKEEVEAEEVEPKTEIEITKEDLQELLKANWIKYHHAAGIKKLTVLANENGLL